MKTVSALMVIALAVLIGVNLHFRRELEAGRQEMAILKPEAQERQAATAASPVPTPAQTPTVADQPSQQGASLGNPVRRGPSPPSPASMLAQMQTPEGQARLKSTQRQMMETLLPDLHQVLDEELGLTAAEKDKLLDLLASQDARGMTTLAPEHESAEESEARQQREYDRRVAELQALLGSKYPQWQDYRETVTVRMEERDLRAALDAAGIPLAQTKERALIEALLAEQRIMNQAVRTSRGVTIGRKPEDRQRLVSAAIPYLSAQQLDEYKALLERKAALIEALTFRRPEPGQ